MTAEGEKARIALELSENPSHDVAVTVSATGKTATKGQDFATGPWTVTIRAPSRHASFAIPITVDEMTESYESFQLEIDSATSSGSNIAIGTNGVATVTIDKDPTAVLARFSQSSYRVIEGDALEVTVLLDREHSQAMTIKLDDTAGTASGSDYTTGPYSVTIPAGKLSASTTIQTTQDDFFDGNLNSAALDETFALAIDKDSLPAGVFINPNYGRQSAQVTIEDDEFTVTPARRKWIVNENQGAAKLTYFFSPAPKRAARLKLFYADQSAKADSSSAGSSTNTWDYRKVYSFPNLLDIAPGTEKITISIPINDDDFAEQNEKFVVTANPGSFPRGHFGVRSQVVIRDDDPRVAFISDKVSVFEGDVAKVIVQLTDNITNKLRAAPFDISFKVKVRAGSATAGTDFQANNELDVTIRQGGKFTEIHIPTLKDTVEEEIENFTLEIDAASFQEGRSAPKDIRQTATVKIHPPSTDPVPSASIVADSAQVTAGNNSTFTVQLTPLPQTDVSVGVFVAQHTGQYVKPAHLKFSSVSIDKDTGEGTFTVPTRATHSNSPGKFSVTIVRPNFAPGSTGIYTVGQPHIAKIEVLNENQLRIQSEDVLLNLDGPVNAVQEGEPLEFIVRSAPVRDANDLSQFKAPTRQLVLNFSVQDDTDGADYVEDRDFTATFEADSLLTHIAIQTIDDDHREADGSVTITLKSGDGYQVGVGTSTAEVLDNDGETTLNLTSARVNLTAAESATEGDNVQFTLTVDPVQTTSLPVALNISQSGDFLARSSLGKRTVTIPSGESQVQFLVPTIDDNTDEADGRITATLNASSEYEAGEKASVALIDDDATQVTISDVASTLENTGGSNDFYVTLGRALVPGEAISVPLVFSGTAIRGNDYKVQGIGANAKGVQYSNLASNDPTKPPTIIFSGPTEGLASLGFLTNSSAIRSDTGKRIIIKLGTPSATGLSGGANTSGTVSFAVLKRLPEISIESITTSISEGLSARFKVISNQTVDANLTIHLNVSEASGGEMLDPGDKGRTTATIPKGEAQTIFTVATVDDRVAESASKVNVTIQEDTAGNYTIAASPKNASSVIVSDNDAIGAATLSIDDQTVEEGDFFQFPVELSAPVSHRVTVSWYTEADTAKFGHDFELASGVLTFRPGQRVQHIYVFTIDDLVDEDPETLTVILHNAQGATIAKETAVGTIVNSDPMPAKWLSRFGRTVAEQALDSIERRLETTRVPGVRGTAAGQTISFGEPSINAYFPHGDASGTLLTRAAPAHSLIDTVVGQTADGRRREARTLSARDALVNSNFSLTEKKDYVGGNFALWGQAARSTFKGQERNLLLDGEVTTAYLGADYANEEWLFGFALMQSKGDGNYRNSEPTQTESSQSNLSAGETEVSMTSVLPYAALQLSERVKIWGAAGFGSGDLTLNSQDEPSRKTNIDWSMAAVGIRTDLLVPPSESSGALLTLKSDALWTSSSSEKIPNMAASDSDTTRLRLGLEGGYRIQHNDANALALKLNVGIRHDGGDAETGRGLELTGGLGWTNSEVGLALDIEGTKLISHNAERLEQQGFAAAFTFDPQPRTQLGPSVRLRNVWGNQPANLLDTPPSLNLHESSAPSGRWSAEAAYGFPAFGGHFTGTPYLGLDLATGMRDYSLGWRLSPAAHNPDNLFLHLKTVRRERDSRQPEIGMRIDFNARW